MDLVWTAGMTNPSLSFSRLTSSSASPLRDEHSRVSLPSQPTLNPVARTAYLSNFANGTYLRLHVDGGVRLRVMPIAGFATVSAVFVDPLHNASGERDKAAVLSDFGRESGVLGRFGMQKPSVMNAVRSPHEYCVTRTSMPREDL